MFAKLSNGQLQKYPYTLGMLRKDNPHVSFPKNPSDDSLVSFGVVRVAPTPRPDYDYTKDFNVTAEQINGAWVEKWIAINVPAEEVANRTNQKAADVREERNSKLAESDWTQILDAPVDRAAWATYRQSLRDVTLQAGFPWNVSWPVKPE